MNAQAGAVVEQGGRVRRLSGRPPLALRQVRGGRRDIASLCLVGAAAGPLAGDDLRLDLYIHAQAHAALGATGATLAQGRLPSVGVGRMRTTVTVGCGASLQGAPPPLVACSGSATEVGVELALCAGASIDWRELVVLGRSGESAGTVRLTWDVTVEGRPLLRQCVDLTDPNMVAWPGMLMGQRVIATQLVVGDPDGPIRVAPRTVVRSARAVAQQLDDRSVLLTVLAADAMTAGRELGLLRQAVLPQRSVAS